MGIFQKIRDGLKKTRDSLMRGLRRMLGSFTKIDEELFEQLEETMIMGDMGVDTVDLGVPVLAMHAPFEITSKLDVYYTYKAFAAFNQ